MTRGFSWVRARLSDEDRIREFLGPREAGACACSGKLRSATGKFALPPLSRGALYMLLEEGSSALRSVVFFSSTGTVLPVFESSRLCSGSGPSAATMDALLRKLRTAPLFVLWKPEAAIGLSSHVALLEDSFGWNPTIRIAYDTMILEPGSLVPTATDKIFKGLTIRPATLDDLEDLMPIAMAYDQDEVLTPLHRFNYDACKAGQVRSLTRYRVYLALLNGQIVGRAQTNATGYAWEQLGGIYVDPENRGRGIATILVGTLVAEILASGNNVCLFVKKANSPARRSYEKLGFSIFDDFSVDYFG